MSRISFLLLLFMQTLFANPNYSFEAHCQKRSIYQGEQFKVTFVFSFKDEKKLAEVNFSPPIFSKLHIVKKEKLSTKNSQSWVYTLSATKTKEVAIGEAYLDIAIKKHEKEIGAFNDLDYEYISLKTKPLFLKVKEAKKSDELFGEFDITATVDKKILTPQESINLTLKISGEGNLYDIKKFELKIPDATVYSDKPLIKDKTFIQKFSIIADSDIVIPPFELRYIDKTSKKEIVKKTKPIMITLKEEISKHNKTYHDSTKNFSYVYLILSFVAGFVSAFLLFKLKLKRKERDDMEFKERIKNSKNTKEILKLLLLEDSHRYKHIIDELERDIYLDKSFKLTKKELEKKIFTTD